MKTSKRKLFTLTATGVCAVVLAGCGTSTPNAEVRESSTPSSSATVSATPPPPAPKVGQCRRLTFAQATSPTNASDPINCDARHNAVTYYVGRLDLVKDGHLLTVDSDAAQKQIADTCPDRASDWLGGSVNALRLSQFRSIWFSPTLDESAAGANWFRCDLVVPTSDEKLVDLADTRNVLAESSGLDTWGTCGNAAPDADNFSRTRCAADHTWRAAEVYTLPEGTGYLGEGAQAAADDHCKTVAQDNGNDPLQTRWAFEWPTQDEWDAGQRWGLCWIPSND